MSYPYKLATQQRHRRQPPSILNRQQGVVLVVALFIVAIVASLSYFMLARVERDTRRTTLLLRNTQAGLYAQGSIDWAIDQLASDWSKQKPNQPIDQLPLLMPANTVHGYTISGQIDDMQARFNLNNLNNASAQPDFIRLLQTIAPSLPAQQAQNIVLAIVDWITPATGLSQYDKYYLALPLPYRSAHRPMLDISELRLVKDVSTELFKALQPYVAALPAPTLINVATAQAPVLVTLSPDMTLATALSIEQLRATQPILSVQTFLSSDLVKNHPVPAEKITVTSDYFLVKTSVTIEEQQTVLYTLLHRSANQSKTTIDILWQSKGVE